MRDISICHRQFNPSEKKKYGKNYIQSIYVKFVNRSLVKTILKKRYLLKNFPQFSIKENLTLYRRNILDRVKEELVSYPHNWVSNGNIFVKKTGCRPIMVNTVEKFEELLELQFQEYDIQNADGNLLQEPPENASGTSVTAV